ncbi:DISARM system SNF2-like helicase DrmD [Streptomyces lunaelactis]|uniref:DISARM system SNF2-like helicase DrmD n=1 Tax=Streptomyces lunaelactis TaxID=1535768 RepID=UPI0020C7A52A|nr:DISARM system SNF2-like helicase DrmD [Streptomyces lunaelactis]
MTGLPAGEWEKPSPPGWSVRNDGAPSSDAKGLPRDRRRGCAREERHPEARQPIGSTLPRGGISVVMSVPDTLEVGQLVRVRGQQWVVSRLDRSGQPEDQLAATPPPGRPLVTLNSVSDDDLGEELPLVWEVEPGREVAPATQLPAVTDAGWDDPQRLGAFLDAVRWGTVASADTRTLQSPFRSGITIEEYQLEPVARALAMPRVNLLIADDVGLGKTIEAGLVVQELLLRHRARRVLVVCPAPLTLKWREEMGEKFGLDFVVLDAAALRELRRTHGLEANPFTVHPRAIISLPWLRTPRVQRLLDEVLTPQTRHPGFFDLLIVDEAHHCAPPAPARGRGYAVDSLQTRAVRRLGEHSQHRLFLSATPHNGYSESWQALLAMLDPQRFTRGVPPDEEVLKQVMVRRLKSRVLDADGQPVFPARTHRAVEVEYTEQEKRIHGLLEAYAARRRRTPGQAAVRANDLVTLLLKKRLFSSPAAFARTLAAHAASVNKPDRGAAADELPTWLDEALAWDDEPDDIPEEQDPQVPDTPETAGVQVSLDEHVSDLLGRAAEIGAGADPRDEDLLEQMLAWADRHGEHSDSKANALVAEIDKICRSAGEWNHQRVIVFTEYRDTQRWLAELLASRGMGGERTGLLYGGMDPARREHLKAAFQADPQRDKVRILLATDTASEGIDLQRHCHRVIHYDIPFNPNRLEQRIGRVDRRGQHHEVEVLHFVGSGWQRAEVNSYDADLEFLSRVAAKVATERNDLGSVNPVLAHAVESRMLGRPVLVDPLTVDASPSVTALRGEQDLREQARKLRLQLESSKDRLHVGPPNVRRVVDTALELAGQPPLADRGDGEIDPPVLHAGWERTVLGLADPLSGTMRPLSFDQAIVGDRDDVVLAHLEHPLVAQSVRLLRSAVWGGRTSLNRVAAVRAVLPEQAGIDGPLVAVFSRLVVVGKDGARLHEEVVLTGRVIPSAGGRSRRLELEQPRYADLREAVEQSLEPDACRPAPAEARSALAQQWDELMPRLAEDVRVRASERLATMSRTLNSRAADETRRIHAVFDQLRVTLANALEGQGPTQLSLEDLESLEVEERKQLDRDRKAWEDRLDSLDEERERELAATEARYADVRELVFPFAVALIVPAAEETR